MILTHDGDKKCALICILKQLSENMEFDGSKS